MLRQPGPPAIRDSLQEYGRGLAGGLLFSLPLLYTMEVWWAGFSAAPLRLATLVGFTYILLLGYNRYSGMHRDAQWVEVAVDSVEELGLGLVTAAVLLFLLGRIGPDSRLEEALGKVVVEAAVVAIGFSVGTAQLHASGDSDSRQDEEEPRLAGQLAIAFCGAVLFAANVAPTEEIQVIAVETGPSRLLGIAALSMLVASLVLYFTNFRQTDRAIRVDDHFDVLRGTAVTYAIALVSSALLLWFFGRFEGAALEVCVSQMVVLGLPAVLGASAGRMLLTS